MGGGMGMGMGGRWKKKRDKNEEQRKKRKERKEKGEKGKGKEKGQEWVFFYIFPNPNLSQIPNSYLRKRRVKGPLNIPPKTLGPGPGLSLTRCEWLGTILGLWMGGDKILGEMVG